MPSLIPKLAQGGFPGTFSMLFTPPFWTIPKIFSLLPICSRFGLFQAITLGLYEIKISPEWSFRLLGGFRMLLKLSTELYWLQHF